MARSLETRIAPPGEAGGSRGMAGEAGEWRGKPGKISIADKPIDCSDDQSIS